MSSSSPLRLLPMPPEEMRGHSWVAQCNDERFTLHGERRDRCLPSSVGLADMPLHKVRSQMVCGACRARSPLPPHCRTVVEVDAEALLEHPEYHDTRFVLRSRFQATLNSRGLGFGAESVLADAERHLVVAMHLPGTHGIVAAAAAATAAAAVAGTKGNGGGRGNDDNDDEAGGNGRYRGFHLTDGDDGHDRPMALSWWVFGLNVIMEHVQERCIVVHVLTDAPTSAIEARKRRRTNGGTTGNAQKGGVGGKKKTEVDKEAGGDLAVLEERFPEITFVAHGAEVAEEDALVIMARSHVLLAGGGAFSRLAAVLSKGVVLAPGSVPRRPLHELRAVVVVFDPRFWDRSGAADVNFWEGLRVQPETARLTQLFLNQRHPPNTTAASRCLKVAPNTNCRLRWTQGTTSVQCT